VTKIHYTSLTLDKALISLIYRSSETHIHDLQFFWLSR